MVIVIDASGDIDPSDLQGIGDAEVLLLAPGNLGYAGGNNLGFLAALSNPHVGEVLVVNPDVEDLDGPGVDRLVAALGSQEGPAVAMPGLSSTLSPGAQWGRYIDARTGLSRPAEGPPGPHGLFHFHGAAVMFNREALERVGGFDSNLFLYYEEVDWCLRARPVGVAFVTVGTTVTHRESTATQKHRRAVALLRARNVIWVRRRHGLLAGRSILRELWWVVRRAVHYLRSGEALVALASLAGSAWGLSVRPPQTNCTPSPGLSPWQLACLRLRLPPKDDHHDE